MIITSVSTKGQIVIPRKLREKMALNEGDNLVLFELNGLLVCKKISEELSKDEERRIESFYGKSEEKNTLSHTNHRDYIR